MTLEASTYPIPERRYDADETWVRHPWDPEVHADGQTYTSWHEAATRPDYEFTVTIPQGGAGNYMPWAVMTSNPGEACHVWVKYVSCEPQGGSESLAQFRPTGDQTSAVLAAPVVLGKRLKKLRDLADNFSSIGKHIEVANTSWDQT